MFQILAPTLITYNCLTLCEPLSVGGDHNYKDCVDQVVGTPFLKATELIFSGNTICPPIQIIYLKFKRHCGFFLWKTTVKMKQISKNNNQNV